MKISPAGLGIVSIMQGHDRAFVAIVEASFD